MFESFCQCNSKTWWWRFVRIFLIGTFEYAFRLTSDEKYVLCRSIGEECLMEAELKNLLEKKPNPVAYDGFEPSGRMHIAQGVMKALNVNKLTKSGVTFRFWCV